MIDYSRHVRKRYEDWFKVKSSQSPSNDPIIISPVSKSQTSLQTGAFSIILFAILALALIIGVVRSEMSITDQAVTNRSKKNTADNQSEKAQVSGVAPTSRNLFDKPPSDSMFQIPNECVIKSPILDNGLTFEYIQQWRKKRGQIMNAHVLILHWDSQQKKLFTALHRRHYFNQSRDGPYPIAHPGGQVEIGETLWEGTARELREEAMKDTEIPPEHLHLLNADMDRGLHGTFVMFVGKPQIIDSGPQPEYAHELWVDEMNGFVDPSRQRWFQIQGNRLKGLPKELEDKYWFGLRKALDLRKMLVKCS